MENVDGSVSVPRGSYNAQLVEDVEKEIMYER